MTLQQLKEEARKFDIRDGEKLANAFIRNYCNDHQELRWLRGAFLDEDDKMNTMIEWLKLADSLIDKAYKEGKIDALTQISKIPKMEMTFIDIKNHLTKSDDQTN